MICDGNGIDMKKTIYPLSLKENIVLPTSKSVMIRMLFCAAVSDRPTVLCFNGGLSSDIRAAVSVLESLGALISVADNKITVNPITALATEHPVLKVGESATVMRFAVFIAAALGAKKMTIIRSGSLKARPLLLSDAFMTVEAGESVEISVCLKPGTYSVNADKTSQTASGMLIAAAIMGDTEISVKAPASKPYIVMTAEILRLFGVEINEINECYKIKKQGLISPQHCRVGGDWSAAAFLLCGGLIQGKEINIKGLDETTLQGDRIIKELLTSGVKPFSFFAGDNPDLVPPLAALACYCPGKSVIYGADNLRQKESDRLSALTEVLSALGGDIRRTGADELTINGKAALLGGCEVDTYNDHRIAMAAAIAALGCMKPVILNGCECVSKSWEGFFDNFYENA